MLFAIRHVGITQIIHDMYKVKEKSLFFIGWFMYLLWYIFMNLTIIDDESMLIILSDYYVLELEIDVPN